jgi:HD-GYP domain-containing protein (c-di-GMP phosphodiesterase class II)
MLKRIDPADVTLGMFIHKLEGNWFLHPFWRAHFLLTDPTQLQALHASRVPAVIIDTERGLDPDRTSAQTRPDTPRHIGAHPPAARKTRLPPPPPILAAPTAAARILAAPPAQTVRAFGRASAVANRELKVVTHVFLEMRLGKAITPASVSPVITSIMASLQSNPFAFNGLMRFRRDSEAVYQHALATSALMITLARSLHLPPLDLHAAGVAGLLLDSGVSLLPTDDDDHPVDPRRLSSDVWQSHVQLGHDFILRSRLSEPIARACLEHHERFDGTGWPHGTGGPALSRLGRMAAICDAYDLLASPGDGRAALDPAEALQIMKGDIGAYDPDILAVFETAVGVWPIGSLVALRSGRLAVVVDQNRDALDRPVIAVFFAPVTGERIDDLWIDLNTCYGADAIVGAGSIADLAPPLQAEARAALVSTLERLTGTSKPTRRTSGAA